MKRILFGLACTLMLALPITINAGDAPVKTIPELIPLANYIGKWEVDQQGKLNQEQSKKVNGSGLSSSEWFLDGRFVKQTWTSVAGEDKLPMSGETLYTFDTDRNVYRIWQFLSNGRSTEGEGVWDDKIKCFFWTFKHDGMTTRTKADFSKPGKESWSMKMTDKDSKVILELSGSNTKK